MKGLLAVAVLVLTASACASGHPTTTRTTESVQAAVTSVSSSRLVLGGNVRITATVPATVEVGRPLTVEVAVRNVSKTPRKIQLSYGLLWAAVRSPDGTTWDSRKAFPRGFGGPFVPETTLRPGATVTTGVWMGRSHWSGPLELTAGWGETALPALRVGVTVPSGPLPSDRTTIDDVVSHAGGLLDHCRPEESGVAVTGVIVAPKHSAPPMPARCSIAVRHEHGFNLAQVLVASPPTYDRVHVTPPYQWITGSRLEGNASASAWLFVVTSVGTTSVDSYSMESTKPARGGAPQWQWTTSGVEPRQGGSHCGGTGGGGDGPSYEGPFIKFVTACR
ncbi:MAG: hypothetical protein QOG85_1276 [Gaiellaceae bacterium]|nr:hypothetical protein [Gaiellaceae bacterium]